MTKTHVTAGYLDADLGDDLDMRERVAEEDFVSMLGLFFGQEGGSMPTCVDNGSVHVVVVSLSGGATVAARSDGGYGMLLGFVPLPSNLDNV